MKFSVKKPARGFELLICVCSKASVSRKSILLRSARNDSLF